MNTFRFIDDPGHGWLEVPVSLLRKLDLIGKITAFSYLNGAYAYLEEDVDMPMFLSAMRQEGEDADWVTVYQDPTPIRGYPSFSADALT